MSTHWLWDRNISAGEVKKILKSEQHPRFIGFAALLLARNNEPREIFGRYLKKETFARHWSRIKRRMRRDKWMEPRIIFWQAVYEKVFEQLKKQGIVFRSSLGQADALCLDIGRQIKVIRKKKGLSQKDLAGALGITQQVISRIETGRENMSLLAIKRIADVLNRKIVIQM